MPAAVAREVSLFAVVGVAATALHVCVALSLNTFAGVGPLAANFCGYLCAFAVSYFGNAAATFRQPALNARQFGRFATLSLAAFALNQALVFVGVRVAGLPLALALVPALILVPTATFVVAKFWAFRRRFAPRAQSC